MTEPARVPSSPVAVPTLAEVLADPGVLVHLPADVLVALRHHLRVVDADLERAITLGLLSNHENHDDDIAALTPARLAERWGISEAKARELCRTGQIPARKVGREWIVPVAGLRRWVLEDGPVPRHDPHPAVRPYTIRRAPGGSR